MVWFKGPLWVRLWTFMVLFAGGAISSEYKATVKGVYFRHKDLCIFHSKEEYHV